MAGISQFYLLHANIILGESLLSSPILDRLCSESFLFKIVVMLLAK